MSEILERTYEFVEPGERTAATAGQTGLDYLRAQMNGDIARAPIYETLGMRLIRVEPSWVVVEAEPETFLLNTLGTVHGGFAASLLDTAMGCAVHTTLKTPCAYTTIDLCVNFIRPIGATVNKVIAVGEVLHPGKRVTTAVGRVEDATSGMLLAHGTTTCMLMSDGAG